MHAGEGTDNLRASYSTKGSRQELLLDPRFAVAFAEAKAWVRRQNVRYLEEVEPVRQSLLEVYIAMVLGTSYNDFENH